MEFMLRVLLLYDYGYADVWDGVSLRVAVYDVDFGFGFRSGRELSVFVYLICLMFG